MLKLKNKKIIITFLLIVLSSIVIFSLYSHSPVEDVKNSYINQVIIEKAFNKYFTSEKWYDVGKDENNNDGVLFEGKHKKDNYDIHFIIEDNNVRFSMFFKNDKKLNNDESDKLIQEIVSSVEKY